MSRRISVNDTTLRTVGSQPASSLPFRIKIEVARMLSALGVDVIETPPVLNGKTDYFLVKSIVSAVNGCTVAVPVNVFDAENPSLCHDALKDAAKPRLQVSVPVSTVQMEYFCHKKPDDVLKLIAGNVSCCAALCPEVEFVAEDFGRADPDFLMSAIGTAVENGAGIICLADAAGDLLGDEFQSLVARVRSAIPGNVRLGVWCSNDLYMADSCAIAAVRGGADEVKVAVMGNRTVSLKRFPRILNMKEEVCGAFCGIRLTELDHTTGQIGKLCEICRNKVSTVSSAAAAGEIRLSVNDDKSSVLQAIGRLGYDLGEEDSERVYDTFLRITSKDEVVGAKELDAIVASAAFQVPPVFRLESFVINTGNVITPTCNIRLRKGEDLIEKVCVGEGPVDAAFLAIDEAVGRHYELDDFQVRSVTEGREAMGETVVRLRWEGRLYSGRAVSKDIVESGLLAYLNAVNKIAYEEEEA